MRRTSTIERQRLGCGYEKPSDQVSAPMPLGMKGEPLKHCPGYTTKLPEVIEASWARFYLEKGSLAQWSDTPITEHVREAIQILEIAIADEKAHEDEEREREQKQKAGVR